MHKRKMKNYGLKKHYKEYMQTYGEYSSHVLKQFKLFYIYCQKVATGQFPVEMKNKQIDIDRGRLVKLVLVSNWIPSINQMAFGNILSLFVFIIKEKIGLQCLNFFSLIFIIQFFLFVITQQITNVYRLPKKRCTFCFTRNNFME